MRMDDVISAYKERLYLKKAHFSYIDHDDVMVATVFKVILEIDEQLILKICSRSGDYLREAYFLNHFAEKLPVPRIIQLIPPETDLHGAVLMECLPGELLKIEDLNDKLAYEIGALLGRIHLDRVEGHGDLTDPISLRVDPRIPFTMKFEEGMDECRDHLPSDLLTNVRQYYDNHIDLLLRTDGPCIVHRDFRPGNIIIAPPKFADSISFNLEAVIIATFLQVL